MNMQSNQRNISILPPLKSRPYGKVETHILLLLLILGSIESRGWTNIMSIAKYNSAGMPQSATSSIELA